MECKVDSKIEQIQDDISEIKTTLAVQAVIHERNTKSLETHIHRTELLEQRQGDLEKTVLIIKSAASFLKWGIPIVVALVVAVVNIILKFI